MTLDSERDDARSASPPAPLADEADVSKTAAAAELLDQAAEPPPGTPPTGASAPAVPSPAAPIPSTPSRTPFERAFDTLVQTPRAQQVWRIGVPAAVLTVAALTRFIGLDHPHQLVFDETYYVKDAWSMWQFGYEGEWAEGSDELFAAGDPSGLTAVGDFVVHGPVGKWIIGVGMAVFGMEPAWAWRLPTVLAGIAVVALTYAIVKGMTRSTAAAGIAGMLLALDGLAIVMSRVALLDQVLTMFVLAAFGCLLLDRRGSPARMLRWRHRRDDALRARDGRVTAPHWGPMFWHRPWLLACGALLGLGTSVKWSALWFAAAFGLLSVVLDAMDARAVGVRFWLSNALLRQGPASFVVMIPIIGAIYLGSYAGWFATSDGYGRTWAVDNPDERWTGLFDWVPLSVQSWVRYQEQIAGFHVSYTGDHPFQSAAPEWLFLLRPTGMYLLEDGDATSWMTALPNPLVWYLSVVALGYALFRIGAHVDRSMGVLAIGVMAGLLPWFLYLDRTIFSFYTVVFEPFLYALLALTVWRLAIRRRGPAERRWPWQVVGASLGGLALALFAFFAPMWYGTPLPTEQLRWRFWIPRWR